MISCYYSFMDCLVRDGLVDKMGIYFLLLFIIHWIPNEVHFFL
uniref:Uncharacterized protein n=1 Tax=Rhizophora mucronata TaxID=61149 RepID=A0A2P2IT61_RHIMU